ncbi:MAG TPA: hypothetical protein VFW38_08300 [Solirubrobacteraceae bacterium]|nr:hypothetical protein [Solirubrobacteraceae bacterium]
MSDADIAVLTRELDLTTHMHPKLHDSPVPPGLTRIDFYSGLFLERDANEGHWVLEGRTWGNPPSWFVHDWHIRAAAAARQLDPTVTIPDGVSAPAPVTPTVPLARDANKRVARPASHVPGLR